MATYTIIGGDGKPYGPVADYELEDWIRRGRITADTQIQPDGEKEWKRLADFPEFAEVLRRAKPSATAAPAAVGRGKIFSRPMTLATIIVLSISLVAIVIFSMSGWSFIGRGKQNAQAANCLNNEKQLAIAVRIFTARHNNHLPPAATWCDAIKSELDSDRVFRCVASTRSHRCDYAFNSKLSGADVTRVNYQTVMLFESEGGWNARGGPELLLGQPRHARVINVAFADGSVQQISPTQFSALRWDP